MISAQDNVRGALLMMASMAAFTFNDAFMKMISEQIPLFQLLTLRGVLTTVLVALVMLAMGRLRFGIPRQDRMLVLIRVVAEAGSAYFFLTALFNMPIANVSAIMQALPLTITLAAAVFFREPVGWRRLAAILVGFVGVMLIIRPGADDFTIYSVYTLAAVAVVTVRDLATRRLSAETPSMAVTLYSSIGVTIFFALASPSQGWVPVDGYVAMMIAGAALMVIGGYVCSIMVMRVGEISFVATFRYTSLVWALVLGWLVFGDWPKPVTLLGAAIVIGSGVFMLLRERQLNKRLAMAAAARPAAGGGV
ncbi:DMT family transporter [Lentibacter sp. XHP0401]|uniref:DMT family transporter n=1 Tax=Lentibacter sp. XHP0401 TaxID=2984334 RepID=UPI0021E74A79|nr:DMT family transporter [Lentibacter sp. XHP0401]MCV2892980.1 DMT family transporter [Lentibacter sp. XHP0401]